MDNEKLIIVWDNGSSMYEKDDEYNIMFLNATIKKLNELIETKGYLYQNTIYETLGLEWNSYRYNLCYRNLIYVDIKQCTNGFILTISEQKQESN